MTYDHIHDVSDGACGFCLQSPAIAPRIRSRDDIDVEMTVRRAKAHLDAWLRGDRRAGDHLAWAFAYLGDAVAATERADLPTP